MTTGLLSFLFIIVSFFYSLVGFGGGSSYLAILSLAGVPYELIPIIALLCNILVAGGNCFRFFKNKLIPWDIVKPLILISIPAAFLGGKIIISKKYFLFLLGVSLLIASVRMFYFTGDNDCYELKKAKYYQISILGITIGFLSGMVGIGGGIFLTPLVYGLKWAGPKSIAAISSLFILCNSLAGLTGQLTKGQSHWEILSPYFILLIGVLIGGQFGSYLSNYKLSNRWIQKLTSFLILYVALRLLIFH